MRTHLIALLSLLDRNQWEVVLHAPFSLLSSLPPDLPPFKAEVLPIAGRLSLFDLRCASMLLTKLSPNGIVHAHGLRASWVCSLAKGLRGFTLIVTLHNVPGSSPLTRLLLRFLKVRTNTFVAVSRSIAAMLRPRTPYIIPNGVDLSAWSLAPRIWAEDTPFRVLCVARLSREKGVDLLLAAAALQPEMDFMVAGEGPDEALLRSSAPRNVRFLGRVDNVEALMHQAHCLAVPSRTEGQGIVVLEAFASGLPVVAFAVGGLTETVKDKVTGLLARPGSAADLASKLAEVRDTPELSERLTLKAMDWVRTNGDNRILVKELEQIYRTAS